MVHRIDIVRVHIQSARRLRFVRFTHFQDRSADANYRMHHVAGVLIYRDFFGAESPLQKVDENPRLEWMEKRHYAGATWRRNRGRKARRDIPAVPGEVLYK